MLGLPPLQTRAEPQEPRRMRVLQVKARLEAQERLETRSVRAAPSVPLASRTLQPTQAKGGTAGRAGPKRGGPGGQLQPFWGAKAQGRPPWALQTGRTSVRAAG